MSKDSGKSRPAAAGNGRQQADAAPPHHEGATAIPGSGWTPQISGLPIFYRQVTPLSVARHGRWSYEETGFRHAACTNSVYIAAVEFLKIAREYPIVFAEHPDKSLSPAALLGFEPERNLYVESDGTWRADYVPAYVRRYPFILTSQPQKPENFTVCVDESYAGFNTGGRGQALFSESGEQSETLLNTVRFLREYQGHIQLTSAFCTRLQALDILDPMEATFTAATGERHRLQGFLGVNHDKLRALAPKQLATLVEDRHLDLIYAHLWSLSAMDTFRTRLARAIRATRPTEGTPETESTA